MIDDCDDDVPRGDGSMPKLFVLACVALVVVAIALFGAYVTWLTW